MHPTIPSPCPNCRKHHDAASTIGIEDRPPRPGDFSLCFECGEFHIFSDELIRRKLTDAEQLKIALDPIAQRMQTLLRIFLLSRRVIQAKEHPIR